MFNYHQPNLENMKQYLKENETGDGPKWWSIPTGMSSVRILPPWDPSGRVALPVYMHPIEYKGADMTYTKYNWTCVSKTFNKNCPICEGLSELANAGVDIQNWEANRRQFYFNAIVMHDPTYDAKTNKGTAPGTHVLLKAPKTFYDWVISQITNPMIGDITSVDNGIDIYITKEGTGLGTTYSMTTSPNGRTPIPAEYLEKIKDLYNLDDIFSVGFDQKQIDELVNHLRKEAGRMSNSIPQMQQQMAGYSPQPTAPTQAPPQWNAPQPSVGQFGILQGSPVPNPYQQPTQNYVPAPPSVPTAPVAPNPAPSATSGQPKCFGQYNAGNVNCVVCPSEIPCSNSKK